MTSSLKCDNRERFEQLLHNLKDNLAGNESRVT